MQRQGRRGFLKCFSYLTPSSLPPHLPNYLHNSYPHQWINRRPMPPTMTKSIRPMPRPPCPVLVQGMVNLSSTTYKYRGWMWEREGGKPNRTEREEEEEKNREGRNDLRKKTGGFTEEQKTEGRVCFWEEKAQENQKKRSERQRRREE
jgi:hypothetical protein